MVKNLPSLAETAVQFCLYRVWSLEAGVYRTGTDFQRQHPWMADLADWYFIPKSILVKHLLATTLRNPAIVSTIVPPLTTRRVTASGESGHGTVAYARRSPKRGSGRV